jgi:hypothetical protein
VQSDRPVLDASLLRRDERRRRKACQWFSIPIEMKSTAWSPFREVYGANALISSNYCLVVIVADPVGGVPGEGAREDSIATAGVEAAPDSDVALRRSGFHSFPGSEEG